MNKEDLLYFDNLVNIWIDTVIGSRERELEKRDIFVDKLKNIMKKDNKND